MRIDKFLKVSRVIKRRTVASDACRAGRVFINDKAAKAGSEVKIGDIVKLEIKGKEIVFKVLNTNNVIKKEEADTMYQIIKSEI